MVEVRFGLRTVDLPYSLRLHGVTEEMFNEMVDEDTKAELLDGVMIVHSPASPRHDNVAGFLRTLMRCYADERDLGLVLGPDALVHLASCRKFAPDVFFLRKQRVPEPLPEMEFEVAPDLVIEVLSPSNRTDDLEDKRPAYHQACVPELWFVDPEKETVLVDRRSARGYRANTIRHGRVASFVLKGFWVELAWLWAEPLPRTMTCLRKILRASKPG